ncbi:MAG: apolipoprotein N-acyltransferase [Acidobacteriota bacterium]
MTRPRSSAEPTMRAGATTAWSVVLAVGGGVVWAFCFAREASVLLPWLALAPLVALLGRPRAWLWAWFFGFVSWLVSLPWLVPTVETFGGLPRWLSVVLFLLLCAYLALDQALFGWLGGRLWRRGVVGTSLAGDEDSQGDEPSAWRIAGTSFLVLPALFLLLEWKRGMPIGVFPWNPTSWAWLEVPGALDSMALIGGYGVTFLALAANAGVVLAIVQRRWRLGAAGVLVVASLLLVGGRIGARAAGPLAGVLLAEPGVGQRVVIVQPNNPITYDERALVAGYQRLLSLSERACTGEPTLLLWPESASWPYGWDNAPTLRNDLGRLARSGCTVVLNSARRRDGALFNVALLVGRSDGGAAQVEGEYAKRHLVPYGEYVPLREVLPFVGTLAREAGSFTAGQDPALLDWRGTDIGMAICYEVIFPEAVAEQVRAGAGLLATVTNDAWYGDTWAPWQHLRAARLRAAESRRPMMRAALTGVSAVIDARGRVVDQLGVGETGLLEARLPFAVEADPTPVSRRPTAPLWLSVLVLAFGMLRLRRTP